MYHDRYDLIANLGLEPLFRGHWSKFRKCLLVFKRFSHIRGTAVYNCCLKSMLHFKWSCGWGDISSSLFEFYCSLLVVSIPSYERTCNSNGRCDINFVTSFPINLQAQNYMKEYFLKSVICMYSRSCMWSEVTDCL